MYIYIYICVCVCVCVSGCTIKHLVLFYIVREHCFVFIHTRSYLTPTSNSWPLRMVHNNRHTMQATAQKTRHSLSINPGTYFNDRSMRRSQHAKSWPSLSLVPVMSVCSSDELSDYWTAPDCLFARGDKPREKGLAWLVGYHGQRPCFPVSLLL